MKVTAIAPQLSTRKLLLVFCAAPAMRHFAKLLIRT